MAVTTTDRERTAVEAVPKQLFIGGKWVDGSEGVLPVEDPSTGETIAEVADAAPDDALPPATAAPPKRAEWARVSPSNGAEMFPGVAELLVSAPTSSRS